MRAARPVFRGTFTVRTFAACVALIGGCAIVAGVDEDYYESTPGTGGSSGGAGGEEAVGGSQGGGGNNGGGGNDGGGGSGSVALGDPCASSAECTEGECCTDDACTGTCMVPCADTSACPDQVNMECQHGYCLFKCSVDGDCEQDAFVCHHMCTVCEKKATQGCM